MFKIIPFQFVKIFSFVSRLKIGDIKLNSFVKNIFKTKMGLKINLFQNSGIQKEFF